ncbi:MAG TPA: response regulator [Acidobacteriaceae bacterium]|jgi:CheY-like chemotaxis protein|nr:response regulator [Acidobacteriaceae bacterium]
MRPTECRRILIVDDEKCIADTLALIFRGSGYDAVAYYDGASALASCATITPDLLITDVTMPGITGIELAILVKQHCPGCKILLFSGLAGSFDLVERAKQQGHDFQLLEKPINPAELLQKVAGTFGIASPLQFPRNVA